MLWYSERCRIHSLARHFFYNCYFTSCTIIKVVYRVAYPVALRALYVPVDSEACAIVQCLGLWRR